MAGSFKHVADNEGKFMGMELIENLGDPEPMPASFCESACVRFRLDTLSSVDHEQPDLDAVLRVCQAVSSPCCKHSSGNAMICPLAPIGGAS